jgi:NADP-dependent 3-hydroxy acid dehydrogenase YdfG
MSVSLKDQTVLVVGASSGIGRETAILFAKEGAHVWACARRMDRLQSLQAELQNTGFKLVVSAADAGQPEDMDRLGRDVLAEFGRLDILVYAAGTNTPDRAMTRLTPGIWNSLLEINLTGAFNITHAVLPKMRASRSGHLIYISSISGLMPDVSGAAYQASKRGLVGLAHAIRVEERENGIRTCVVCPGLVNTELLEKRPVKPDPETLSKALRAEDVAELVLDIAKLSPHVTIPEVQIMPTAL